MDLQGSKDHRVNKVLLDRLAMLGQLEVLVLEDSREL